MNEFKFIEKAKLLNFKVEEVFIDEYDILNVYYSYFYKYKTNKVQNWKYTKQSLKGCNFNIIYNDMVEITQKYSFQNLIILKDIL